MATLLLTALGTAIGGPLGGAIGAFLGQQADRRIFGTGKREGPRLKELSVTTSSYGQAIPRQFGRMRVPGTVIWATDLVESKTKTSTGKGQPSIVSYTYSASFAVALSSTPLCQIGRIWADGNLLRGAEGDLKVGGQMRLYCGHGDDPVDPLIAADASGKGTDAPAFRDCAYVVFEDLQLAEFGNRIPALTFEIMADGTADSVALGQLVPQGTVEPGLELGEARGFADEGGPVIGSLAAIDQVFPLICTSGSGGLMLAAAQAPVGAPLVLPEQLSSRSEQDADTRHRQRADLPAREPVALRYYDEDRDYQPGVQRAIGARAAGREAMLDLPATMNAAGARQLANANAHRARWQHERITWRIGELDPAIEPGRVVRLPNQPGQWLVREWEWHDRGVELSLERMPPALGAAIASDPGAANTAPDLAVTPTVLAFFETAPDGVGDPAAPLLYAATSSASAGWRGAALFAVHSGGALEPLGNAGAARAVMGVLTQPLGPSAALLLEPAASLVVDLAAGDLAFSETDIAGLASGANRLMVALDSAQISASTGSLIAASGLADSAPVMASLANPGLSRRPLNPVHPRLRVLPDLAWELCWTRRGRGQWRWHDGVDAALVEQAESYLLGCGPINAPFATWSVSEPRWILAAAERAALLAQSGTAPLWVRQVGTHDLSPALPLAVLA
ncbi:MAG: phage tail protein [Porphyrobacter sp.]|nr:phage tail protein [Porphyrobacter sp.]